MRRAGWLAVALLAACDAGATATFDGGGDAQQGADLAGADLAGADLAGADLAGVDLAGVDLAAPLDGGPATFPDALPGIWLIGWSGGLNHYSWVKFSSNGGAVPGGAAQFLQPMGNSAWTAYWPCS